MAEAETKVVLEQMHAFLVKVIAGGAFRDHLGCRPHVAVFRPEDMDAVVIQMMDFIWAQDMGCHEFSWPADWWQAVRARWCPRWWLAKHPVRLHRKTFQVHVAYPSWRPPTPLEGKSFIWKVQSHDWDGGYRTDLPHEFDDDD